jgi:hypothetical protein
MTSSHQSQHRSDLQERSSHEPEPWITDGTGKSRTMGTLAQLWQQLTGARVIGVATAENAAQVLAAEGLDTAWNIAMFLTLSGGGRQLLHAGDLLIVDEASMVSTAQLTALHQITAAAGAKMLLTGDPAQLPAIGAGGALAMIARQHGCYQLTVVQRMNQAWERDASLRLRDGDTAVLADYDRYGRLLEARPRRWRVPPTGRGSPTTLRGRTVSLLLAPRSRQPISAAAPKPTWQSRAWSKRTDSRWATATLPVPAISSRHVITTAGSATPPAGGSPTAMCGASKTLFRILMATRPGLSCAGAPVIMHLPAGPDGALRSMFPGAT